MHPLLLLALGAAGGWAAYRWLSKSDDKSQSAKEEKRYSDTDISSAPVRDAEDLEPDPKTGIYKSKDDE